MTFKNIKDKWYLDYSDKIKYCNVIINLINGFYKKIETTQHQILNFMANNLNQGLIELSTLDSLFGLINSYFFKNFQLTEYNMQNIILFLSKSYTPIKDASNVSILYNFLNEKYFKEIVAFQRPERSGSQSMMVHFMGNVSLKDLNNYNNLRTSLRLTGLIPRPIKLLDKSALEEVDYAPINMMDIVNEEE